MSEAASAAVSGTPSNQKPFAELRVTGHLMTLEPGLFCIVQTPSVRRAEDGSGLPGVRISLPPGSAGRPESVSISTFRPDGFLNGHADAALVRVSDGPAQILVTVYQAAVGTETAPRLQVLRLGEEVQPTRPNAMPLAPNAPGAVGTGQTQQRSLPDVIAHVQVRGDVGGTLGDWVGERGSKRWIEGFAIAPQKGPVSAKDIEYQAVLGRGWLSPWVEGGQLCGSRGMALPILGMRLRLRGEAAERFDCEYSASFTDGTSVGPVAAGESCEADSLAPMEAFQILVTARTEAGDAARRAPRAGATAELEEVGAASSGKPERRGPPRASAKPEGEPVGIGAAPRRTGAPPPRRSRP